MKNFDQYRQLCNYFFEQVDIYDSSDEEAFGRLNTAIVAFRDICQMAEQAKPENERLFYSCMFDIWLWLGLKQDTPEMAIDQKEKIRASYPEIFAA